VLCGSQLPALEHRLQRMSEEKQSQSSDHPRRRACSVDDDVPPLTREDNYSRLQQPLMTITSDASVDALLSRAAATAISIITSTTDAAAAAAHDNQEDVRDDGQNSNFTLLLLYRS